MTGQPGPGTGEPGPGTGEPGPGTGEPGPGGGSWPTTDRPVTVAGAIKPTRRQLVMYQVVRAMVSGFCRLFWRVRVEGRANLPARGAFIVSAVHRSNVDTPLMSCLTSRRMRFLGKDSLWKYPWSAWAFGTLGGVPVHRGAPDRDALRTLEAAARAGEPLVIFPEGTRKSGPVVEDLFEGAAFVASRTGVPIVPVGIGGSAGAMAVGARAIRPVKVRMIVGEPIFPPPRHTGGRGSRRQVHELTQQLQAAIQNLFDRAQEAAGTPNPAR